MLSFAKLPVMLALLLLAPLAAAQTNLGPLLDAGAKQLSPEEFKLEIVQRTIAGPTTSGGSIEVMYANNGLVQGTGIAPISARMLVASVTGEWRIDDSGRICASMRLLPGTGGPVSGFTLPSRCQFWFRLGDTYFISDSNSDRSMRVLSRKLKQ